MKTLTLDIRPLEDTLTDLVQAWDTGEGSAPRISFQTPTLITITLILGYKLRSTKGPRYFRANSKSLSPYRYSRPRNSYTLSPPASFLPWYAATASSQCPRSTKPTRSCGRWVASLSANGRLLGIPFPYLSQPVASGVTTDRIFFSSSSSQAC